MVKNFIKKTINLIKGETPDGDTDLTSAFKILHAENKEAEKQYGKSFFPDEKKVKKRPEN